MIPVQVASVTPFIIVIVMVASVMPPRISPKKRNGPASNVGPCTAVTAVQCSAERQVGVLCTVRWTRKYRYGCTYFDRRSTIRKQ